QIVGLVTQTGGVVGQGWMQGDQGPVIVAADKVAGLGHRPLDLHGRTGDGTGQARSLWLLKDRAAGNQDGLAQFHGAHYAAPRRRGSPFSRFAQRSRALTRTWPPRARLTPRNRATSDWEGQALSRASSRPSKAVMVCRAAPPSRGPVRVRRWASRSTLSRETSP